MIYLIQNNITKKVYVGQTTRSIEERFKEHCRRGSKCRKLANSINKYGKNNFSIIILKNVESEDYDSFREELNYWEKYYIHLYDSVNNGYNCTDEPYYGDEYTSLRKSKSVIEAKAKVVYQYDLDGTFIKSWPSVMSAVKSFSKTKRHHITDVCNGRRKSAYGFLWSWDLKAMEPYNDENASSKSKKVYQYDLNGNLLNEYNSTQEVKRLLGYNQGNVAECCRGIRKTYKGFVWRYKSI